MINIIVNGEQRELENELSLAELIEKLELPVTRIAVELNQTVVRRADWSKIIVRENDRLEIVHFVGGGSNSILDFGFWILDYKALFVNLCNSALDNPKSKI